MKCKAVNKSGEKCKSNAMKNGYCYFHNPDISENEKRNAVKRGGETNKLIKVNSNIPIYNIKTSKDINKLLTRLINEVLQNGLDLRIATGLSYIANILLKSFEQTELTEKLENIEIMINKLDNKKND